MAHPFNNPRKHFSDQNGPLAGGKLYTYRAGTTTPLATYIDSTETTPNTNPIILDANGEASVWLGSDTYKMVLTDANDVVLWTEDGVSYLPDSSVVTAKLANSSVTTVKINDQAVTTPKIANNAVTPEKIPDGSIPPIKINGKLGYDKIPDSAEILLSKNRVVFYHDWKNPEPIASADVLPSGTGNAVLWGSKGTELFVAYQGGSGRRGYEFSGEKIISGLTSYFSLPAAGNGIALSPDEKRTYFTSGGSPFIHATKLSVGLFDESQPATLPSGISRGLSWSPNGKFLAVAHEGSPYFTVYSATLDRPETLADTLSATIPVFISDSTVSGMPGTYDVTNATNAINAAFSTTNKNFKAIVSKIFEILGKFSVGSEKLDKSITNPGNLPTGNGNGVAWSPDNDLLVVAHNTSPFITIYRRNMVTLTKLTDPASLPAGNAKSVSWSPDGKYLAVAHEVAPYLTIYQYSGGVFTKLPDVATPPTGIGNCVTWSANGKYLAVAHNTTPFVSVYELSAGVFTKLPNPTTLVAGNARGLSWSPTGKYLAVAHEGSPYLTVYKTTATTPANAILVAREVIDV